jgi:hypothetical protein
LRPADLPSSPMGDLASIAIALAAFLLFALTLWAIEKVQ